MFSRISHVLISSLLLITSFHSSSVSASECSPITDATECVNHTKVLVHVCVWCATDQQCHDVGSDVDECTNECCASNSDVSSCKFKNPSDIAATCSINTPDQIRLAFVPDGMTVSWTTPAPIKATPTVRYGLSSSSLSSTATGVTHTYGTSLFHDVILNNLTPSTTYYYQIINTTLSPSSPILSFTSAKPVGDVTPFSLLLVGDMGLTNSQNTIASIKSVVDQDDFVLHVGDISYADDFYLRSGSTYEHSWTMWQDELEEVTEKKAYMVLPGNHEVTCSEATPQLCPEGQRNFTSFKHRFRMPGVESGGNGNLWFSYDYAQAHFIHINMETDFLNAPSGPGSWLNGDDEPGQIDFLTADLEKAMANREKVPWIIVAGHRPYYTSGSDQCAACAEAFEGLFNKYGVDIYFSGHVHWYERLYALSPGGVIENTNYINPTAPVYIVNGAAGNVEGHTTGAKKNFTALIDDSDYGFGRLTFMNRTSLRWQYFRATDKSIADDIIITKFH